MHIYAISLIKNESDFVEYNLTEASKWADQIFVYDNGSTDDTWDIVNRLATTNPKIIPWKSEAKPYDDGLRAEVFNEFRHVAKKGDWWCFILDCDEIYIEDPRRFLAEVPWYYHVVKTESYEYRLTHEDVEEYEFHNRFPEDIPFVQYYARRTYSERRFFRHRDRLVWRTSQKFADHDGVIYPKGIKLKHYQYRSPKQIKDRIKVRIEATKDGYEWFGRDNVDEWREKLSHRNELIKESPEMPRDYIKDVNIIPWYWQWYRIVMHAIGIYP